MTNNNKRNVISKRIKAFSIDITLASFIYIGIYVLIIPIAAVKGTEKIVLALLKFDVALVYYLLVFNYFFIQELIWHKTIGKKINKLKIVHVDNKTIRAYQIILRNIFRMIDIVFIIGLVMIVFKRNHQRLGDVIAKTIVVDDGNNTFEN